MRIEHKGSRLLQNGEFSFDFGAFKITGGDRIHISIKDETNHELKVIDPPEGNDWAPHPPRSDWVIRVARANETITFQADTKLINQHLIRVILREPLEEVAVACAPSQDLLVWGATTFNVTPKTWEHSLESWSIRVANESNETRNRPIAWITGADPQTRCNAWRSQQRYVLVQNLKADTVLLDAVKDESPADKLVVLYLDRGETQSRLGAISLAAKDYTSAQSDFQQAVKDLDRAGPAAKNSKKQVEMLWSRAREDNPKLEQIQ